MRQLDDDTLQRLRMRAAKHGVSMEEEVRQILKRAVATPERVGDLAVRLFSPTYGKDDDFMLPEREHTEPPVFE